MSNAICVFTPRNSTITSRRAVALESFGYTSSGTVIEHGSKVQISFSGLGVCSRLPLGVKDTQTGNAKRKIRSLMERKLRDDNQHLSSEFHQLRYSKELVFVRALRGHSGSNLAVFTFHLGVCEEKFAQHL